MATPEVSVTAATPEQAVDLKQRSIGALMWLRFKRNHLAMAGLAVLIVLYFFTTFAEFFAPYTTEDTHTDAANHPPTRIHFVDAAGRFHFRPFVYAYDKSVDHKTYRVTWSEDTSRGYPLYLFLKRGERVRSAGILPASNVRFVHVRDGNFFPFGTDKWGRDTFSRVLYGGRVSLSIGWVGVIISLALGILMGALSGYFSGAVDLVVQRLIEVLQSVPTLPFWMLLAVGLPKEWNGYQVYFGIVVILSIIGWTGLARSVRGMILARRETQYILAARNVGAGALRIMLLHLVPNISSYLLVSVTLAVPGMIIGETSLSFLGLGIKPPLTSWGAMLSEAQNLNNVVNNLWYLIPALFVIVAVLAFNFVGDGLRDAADPFSRN